MCDYGKLQQWSTPTLNQGLSLTCFGCTPKASYHIPFAGKVLGTFWLAIDDLLPHKLNFRKDRFSGQDFNVIIHCNTIKTSPNRIANSLFNFWLIILTVSIGRTPFSSYNKIPVPHLLSNFSLQRALWLTRDNIIKLFATNSDSWIDGNMRNMVIRHWQRSNTADELIGRIVTSSGSPHPRNWK